jgi:TPR repeat protein
MMAVVVMVISSIVVAWDYYALLASRQPGYKVQVLAKLIIKAEQGEAAAQYMLGRFSYKGLGVRKDWLEAFNWFGEAAGRGHPGAQLALGVCYFRGEGTATNYEASILWFRKVAALNNQEARCYFDLDYGEGFSARRKLADHFQYLAWLGPLALAAAGLIIVVGVVLKRKLIFEPALCVAMVLAVGALGWQWRYGGVETLWRSIITFNPNRYLACKNLGYALLQTGQADEALACFQKAMELEPDNAVDQNNIGNILLENGRLNEALAYYQKAVELEPDNAGDHYNIGIILFTNGRLDEAVAHFQKVIKLWPDNADVHNNLGAALAQKGQLDEAIGHFLEALRLEPGFAKASNNLARALSLRKAVVKQPSPSTKP